MGLFDAVREKAAELLGGASEQVTELTGAEVPNADTVTGAVEGVTGGVTETVAGATDAATGLTDAATGVTEGVTGAAEGAADGVIGAAAETVEPYRP